MGLAALLAAGSGCGVVAELTDQQGPAVDAGCGTADTTPSCPGNLMTNPGFEDGVDGWDVESGTLTSVSAGHSGSFAAHVCFASASAETYYAIAAHDPSVAMTPPGGTYRLDLWVRADPPGQTIEAGLRERSPSGAIVNDGQAQQSVGDCWQELTVTYPARSEGSALVAYVSSDNAPKPACFDVDDICIVPAQ